VDIRRAARPCHKRRRSRLSTPPGNLRLPAGSRAADPEETRVVHGGHQARSHRDLLLAALHAIQDPDRLISRGASNTSAAATGRRPRPTDGQLLCPAVDGAEAGWWSTSVTTLPAGWRARKRLRPAGNPLSRLRVSPWKAVDLAAQPRLGLRAGAGGAPAASEAAPAQHQEVAAARSGLPTGGCT